MAIAVAGTAAIQSGVDTGSPSTSDDTYTAESGSDRALILVVHGEDLSSPPPVFAFGGEPFVGVVVFEGTSGVFVYAGYILDADIPSGAQSTTLGNGSGLSWSNNSWAGHIYTLTGVDQSTPVNPTEVEDSEVTQTTWTTANVTSVTDGILLALASVAQVGGHDAGSDISGYTVVQDTDEGGGSWMQGYKLISTGTSENAVFDWNGDSLSGAHGLFGFAPSAGSSVVITDVDGDEEWDDGDASLVITGTGFV